MAQVLDAPLPRHKAFRFGVKPQVWKCGNLECKNLVSDVDRKSKFKKYCSTECRNYVNENRRRERNNQKQLGRNLTLRPCKTCGLLFKPRKKRNAEYCSTLCNTRMLRGNKINVFCGNCGIEFKSMRNRQYCSNHCKMIHFHRTRLVELEK